MQSLPATRFPIAGVAYVPHVCVMHGALPVLRATPCTVPHTVCKCPLDHDLHAHKLLKALQAWMNNAVSVLQVQCGQCRHNGKVVETHGS